MIINNVVFKGSSRFRKGSEVDLASLECLFEELGFIVKVYSNLSQHEMEIKFRDAAKEDHSRRDMFVGVVMTHGAEKDKLQGSDGRMTSVEQLMAEFLPNSSPTLREKPKVFIFQSCRGGEIPKTAQPADANRPDACVDSALIRTTFPGEADFLLAFSTPPGYVAYRNEKDGSIYIQALVKVIRELHRTTHLLDMLTEVNRRVAKGNSKQMPAPVHTLRAKVFI